MKKTTFSGPVKAGTIRNTTGTTLSKDVANFGSVIMTQSAAITEVGFDPVNVDIVIPANSQIIEMIFLVTVAFGSWVAVGDRNDERAFRTFVQGFPVQTVGNHRVYGYHAGTGLPNTRNPARWKNVGTSDVGLWVDSADTYSSGRAVLKVLYIQNNNLS